MAKKSVKKNYLYNLIYEMFLLIVPIVVTPYVARVLGATGSGQYSYTYSLSTYFTLFAALGFGYYAQREVAKEKDDIYNRSKIFWEIIIVRLIPVAVTLVVYYTIILANVYGEAYSPLMWILSLNVIAVTFDVSFFFKGNEEFGKIVFRNVFIKSIGIACIFLFVKNESDLWLYALIQCLTIAFGNASLWLYLPKVLKKVSLKELKVWRHLLPSLILFVPTIATSVYTSLDKTLIGFITKDDVENGNYEYAEKLVKMTLTVITSLGAVIIPRNAKKFADGDIEGVRSNIYKTAKFVFLIGVPMAFGLAVVSDNLIPWYLGEGYDKAGNLIKILAPIIVIIGLSNVFGLQYLIPSGQDKKFTISIVTGAVINLILNVVLIRFLKSYGAAIATVIAETAVTGMMLFFIRKDIKFWEIIKTSWKYWLAGIFMFLITYFAFIGYGPSISHTIFMILCGVVLYFTILILLKENLVWHVISAIHNLLSIPSKRGLLNVKSNRDFGLDAIKVFACFGVVILHTINKDASEVSLLLYYVGAVSIPLFFMVNGALVLNKNKITFEYCLSKVIKILIITLFWSTGLYLIKGVINNDFSDWYVQILGCYLQRGNFAIFWFFGTMIIIYLLLPLLKLLYDNKKLSNAITIILVAVSAVINITFLVYDYIYDELLYTCIPQTLRLWTYLSYYVLGAKIYKNRFRLEKFNRTSLSFVCLISMIIMTAVCFLLAKFVMSDNFAEYLYDSPIIIFTSIIVFITFISVTEKSKYLATLSQATMGVYILHNNFVYSAVKRFTSGTIVFALITPILVFVLTIIISIILNSNKVLKNFVSM